MVYIALHYFVVVLFVLHYVEIFLAFPHSFEIFHVDLLYFVVALVVLHYFEIFHVEIFLNPHFLVVTILTERLPWNFRVVYSLSICPVEKILVEFSLLIFPVLIVHIDHHLLSISLTETLFVKLVLRFVV